MTISVSADCLAPQPPASDTFAWTVLSALAGSVERRGARRSADDRAAQDPRAVGVRVTGEIEVTLTEEFESTVIARAGGGAASGETDLPAPR